MIESQIRKLILESASEPVLKFDRSGDVPSRSAKQWRKKLLKKAAVEGLWFHDIRRTGSTALYEPTGDVRAAQTILGHSTVSTTEHFLVVSEESSQETLDALASGQKN
ncbi:MAG: tyrosine-type recombinase/integrase [Acidobacteria bacterium]|nr:tyrosine-type recombinase/integrase [Acidobacteriota bacterium]MBI3655137.1 tyrosine-type recombinase/integrase [Acidobacteriota bacterium]